jgi:hypothetical protein
MNASISKKYDDACSNYQRIESKIKNKRIELDQLERYLLIAQGRKEILELILKEIKPQSTERKDDGVMSVSHATRSDDIG